jgi:transcription antitermination factor NusG
LLNNDICGKLGNGIALAQSFSLSGCIGVENLQRDWYVIYSKPHKEEQAQFHLGLKRVESFFPRLQLPGPPDKKKRLVPLFPNYLFARIHLPTEYHYVIWAPGVKKIVSFSDTPVPIESNVIRFLQQNADDRGVIQARSQLRRGQEIEVAGGPFNGLMGIIQDPPDARGRIKILLKLLSRQITVKLGVEFIKAEHAAFGPPIRAKIGSGFVSAAS